MQNTIPAHKVDLVIPAAPKDYNKVPYIIDLAREYIDLDEIHVIVPQPPALKWGQEFSYNPRQIYQHQEHGDVIIHADAHVLSYNRFDFTYRPNWIFQQFLKVFQDVTKNDWYLVLDADIFPVKRLPLWNDDGKPILYLGRDQFHGPYFSFNEEMLGFGKVHEWSFLSECTLYNKQIVRDMLAHCGLTLDEFWNKAVKIIAKGCRMADSELYGSYIYQEQPGVYEIRKLTARLGGRYGARPWTDKEIEREIEKVKRECPEVDIFSLHSWEGGE